MSTDIRGHEALLHQLVNRKGQVNVRQHSSNDQSVSFDTRRLVRLRTVAGEAGVRGRGGWSYMNWEGRN